MYERIIRIKAQDAFVFSDGLIIPAQLQISIGETIFKRINVPSRRPVLQGLFEILNGRRCPPALKIDIAAVVQKLARKASCSSVPKVDALEDFLKLPRCCQVASL
jgi:hypothetical protein